MRTPPFCRALSRRRVVPRAVGRDTCTGPVTHWRCVAPLHGQVAGGRTPSFQWHAGSALDAQLPRRLLTHRASSRCSLQRGLGPPSRRVPLLVRVAACCGVVLETLGQPLWLLRGAGTGPRWLWWIGRLSPGGKPLGCRRIFRLIHGAEEGGREGGRRRGRERDGGREASARRQGGRTGAETVYNARRPHVLLPRPMRSVLQK